MLTLSVGEPVRGDSTLTTDQAALARAVVATVAYADIFDYPLTPAEVHRYLPLPSAEETVRELLDDTGSLPECLTCADGYIMISGRERILETRRRRAQLAAGMWLRARRYGSLIARIPFVRMVAVTGALSVDNVEPGADIDYLIVTEPGRLWVCRLLTVALVRLAALRGDDICPNYFLAETALELTDHTLYAAHELAQMLPLTGVETYLRMRRLNTWADDLLPNAGGPPQSRGAGVPDGGRGRALVEAALRTPLGGRLERWEMERKLRKFARQGGNPETTFTAEWCKGHFDGHGQRVLAAYGARLRSLGVADDGLRVTT